MSTFRRIADAWFFWLRQPDGRHPYRMTWRHAWEMACLLHPEAGK